MSSSKLSPESKPRPTTAQTTESLPNTPTHALSASARPLLALDLAVNKKEALCVPVMPAKGVGQAKTWESLLVPAERVSATMLKDHSGNRYKLGSIFNHGGFGAIRLVRKPDPLVDQVYVAKELVKQRGAFPLREKMAIPPFDPLGRGAKPQGPARDEMKILRDEASAHVLTARDLNLSDLEDVRGEVEALLQTNSPLAPHAILDTPDRSYLLMPLMEGDAHSLWRALSKSSQKLQAERDSVIAKGRAEAYSPERYKAYQAARGANDRGLEKNRQARRDLALTMIKSGADGLLHLQRRNLAHRDIKPENFLSDREGKLYLSDYGLVVKDELNSSRGGSLDWMPPEALARPSGRGVRYYPSKADMWSLGASAMAILTGESFTADILGDADGLRSFWSSKDKQTQIQVWQMAYRKTWDAYDALYRSNIQPQLNRGMAHTIAHGFEAIIEAAPDLFGVLLSLMAPDARMRPSAEALSAALTEFEGEQPSNFLDYLPGPESAARKQPAKETWSAGLPPIKEESQGRTIAPMLRAQKTEGPEGQAATASDPEREPSVGLVDHSFITSSSTSGSSDDT